MKILKTILIVFGIVTALASQGFGVEYNLRADYTNKTMPDGNIIPMWGFAIDSSFGALDGTITVPGPLLTVPVGDPNLIIHLDNNLNVPVSIVINGQNAIMTPVKFTDTNGKQRVQSFTHETAPGNTIAVDYAWTNFQPGTYMYQSGTHPAVQVQMGLYGGAVKDANTGQAYQGVAYGISIPLFFSEIDPNLHNAVATDNYGAGKPMTSTIDYLPKYFLINGQPFVQGQTVALPAGNTGDIVLLRLFNMGLETRCPLLLGDYMTLIAEDGQQYTYPKEQYVALLAAGKTIDALVTFTLPGTYPIFDRRLGLTNAQLTDGGMLAYLEVGGSPINAPPVINSVTATPASILDTQTSQLQVNAADTDGPSPLSYNWIVPPGAGSVSNIAIANPIYTPPDIAGTQVYTLTVEVSDGLNTVSGTVNVTVVNALVFSATFNTGTDSFRYFDDTFRGTAAPAYESGARITSGGFDAGALRAQLGGIDNTLVNGMSGGWRRTFNFTGGGSVNLSFRYNLTQTPNYESNEFSDMLLMVDGVLVGAGPNDYIARITGNGNGGPNITTGWQLFNTTMVLSSGSHTITIGGYNNRKDNRNEQTTILIDDVVLMRN
jgi:FtsP/CotA-like multicopper oxidase with cupredoxin domain